MQEQKLAYVSSKSPLASGNDYWGMSPAAFGCSDEYGCGFFGISGYGDYSKSYTRGARPSISLKPDVEYSSGDGSVNSPYKITID